MSSKKNRQLDRVWDQAQAQVQAKDAQSGLENAEREGVATLIARKDKPDYVGKEIRAEKQPEDREVVKGRRKRHLFLKATQNGEAIDALSEVVSVGKAINQIDAKRGSRAPREMPRREM